MHGRVRNIFMTHFMHKSQSPTHRKSNGICWNWHQFFSFSRLQTTRSEIRKKNGRWLPSHHVEPVCRSTFTTIILNNYNVIMHDMHCINQVEKGMVVWYLMQQQLLIIHQLSLHQISHDQWSSIMPFSAVMNPYKIRGKEGSWIWALYFVQENNIYYFSRKCFEIISTVYNYLSRKCSLPNLICKYYP